LEWAPGKEREKGRRAVELNLVEREEDGMQQEGRLRKMSAAWSRAAECRQRE